jgi:hypothetical protein
VGADDGEKVRMRVPALEVEGVGAVVEQAGELGGEDGSRVPLEGGSRVPHGGGRVLKEWQSIIKQRIASGRNNEWVSFGEGFSSPPWGSKV